MVAVITGNGLGLGNTSLTQLGQSQGGSPSLGQAANRSYVNSATGNLVLQNADEGLLFDGLPLNVLRTYNSLGQLSSNGWSYGFSRTINGLTGTLNTAGSTITRTDDDGSSVVYTYNATVGVYQSTNQSGAIDTLSWNATSSTWTWTDAASSTQETYNATGQLTALTNTSNGASYNFSYTNGQLAQITASDGDVLLFGYNTSNQLISLTIQEIPPGQSTAVTRQAVSYGYDSQGRLSTVTTTLGSDTDSSTASYTTTYAYQGTTDLISSVTQSDGTTVSYSYTQDAQGAYQVTGITTGTGSAAQALTLSYGTNSTTVTDGLGNVTTYQTNVQGQLTSVIAPAINGSSPTTSYTYDANGNLLTRTDPNGAVTSYAYDANGNLLSVEDGAGNTVSYTYDANDQVTSKTIYTVPAQGQVGQSGYVAPSGAETTYYVYTASHQLAYTIDPLGAVTEHDYTTANGLSELTTTRQYLGATYNVSSNSNSPSAPPTLAQLQAWVQSSAVQSTLSQSTRTDYSYDVRGQLATQTQYDTVDANGNGVLTHGTVITTTSYDVQGRLLQTSTKTGTNLNTLQTTTYAYDGLGRVISQTDPLKQVTSYVYTDSANTLAITQANGLTTTQVRNSAGQLFSSTQSASGQTSRVTSYLYNADGQAIVAIDPAGNATYTYYDADGRVTGTVDGDGNLTAYTYDAAGHVIQTTRYATQVNTAGWLSTGALTSSYPTSLPVPASSANDRITTSLYNAAGKVIATIDPANVVTTVQYDGTGQVVATTQYATPLTNAQRNALGGAPTWAALQADLTSNANNRTTLTLHDADGRVVATIDAQGYVTVTAYNAAGEAVLHTAYATALTPSQLSNLGDTPSLAAVQADLTSSAQDQITRTYYDGEGRVVAVIDADGYLTVTGYDETTNTTSTTRYAMALTSTQLHALTGSETVATLVGLLGSNTANEQSSVTTDGDGQVTSRITINDQVSTYTYYAYNSVDQLVGTAVTPWSQQGTVRTTSATYDAFGDELTHTDATNATTTYAYNALGQQIEATDALGNSTWTYYDADGKRLYTIQGQPSGSTRNALGNVTAYQYDAFGEVTRTTTYAASLTLITSGSHSGTSINPNGATASQVAAAIAALVSISGDANAVSLITYTLDGQVATVTDGNGYQTANTYDAFGDVTQVQQQLSQPGSAPTASNSTTTTYTYDTRGERLNETDGVGTSVARTTAATYDAFGRITSRTDGNGHTITYTYDALGRQISSSQTVQGATRSTQTTYDAFGNVLTETDALGNVTTFSYNVTTHTATVTTPGGITTTTVKDVFGDTVSVTDGGGHTTTYTYDADGRLLTTTDALGNVSRRQYDADGELIQTTDASGHVVTYTYNASGKVLTQTVDPNGLKLTTTYAYGAQGRTLSVTDPMGSVTTYSYDADGHVLTQVVDAAGLALTTTYTYDGEGKTLTVTTGAGTSAATTTQYVYDTLERLSQTIVAPGALNLTTTYTYDANNNLINTTDPNGNVTRYVYDEANAKIFTIDPTGAVTQQWFDADGRLTSTRGYLTVLTASQLSALGSTPTVAAISADLTATPYDTYHQRLYNADGQVVYELAGVGLNTTQYTYDAAGRVTQTRVYANRPSVSASTPTSFNPMARPADLTSALTASANDLVTTTAYNADGQAVYAIDGAGAITQTVYDAAGRVTQTIAYATPLTSAQLASLGSTPTTAQIAALITTSANDRTSTTSYDTAGRVAYTLNAAGAVTQTTYDADGRVTSTHAYATALTAAQLASLGNTPTPAQIAALVATSASDVITYNVYDSTGALRYHLDALRYVTETRYDAAGRVSETLAYPNAISTANETSALQAGTAYSWLSGQVGGASSSNPDSSAEATLTLYDAAGRRAFTVQQNGTAGQVTGYAYDANGNLIRQTVYGNTLSLSTSQALSAQLTTAGVASAVASFTAQHATTTVYDADNRALYTIDALGDVTQLTYDGAGRLIETQQYANAITLPGTINAATIAAAITAAGTTGVRTTTTSYTSRGQVMSTVDALGTNASYTYNGLGQKISYTNRDGAVWTYTYDSAGRLIQTQSPQVTVGSYSTTNGQFQTATSQSLYTSNTYDAFGDLVSVSQGYGASASAITTVSTTGYAYDALGRRIQTTDALGHTTTTTYNALGQAVVAKDANGNLTYTVYDADGRVLDRIDGNGYVTAYTYDAYGNVLTTAQYATALNTAAITGWSIGQPLTAAQVQQGLVTSSNDRITTTSYNQLNQKTQVVLSSIAYDLSMGALGGNVATGTPTTTYTYDAYGNLISTAQLVQGAYTSGATTTPAVWATTYTYYDALNRAVMVVTPTDSYTTPQGYVTTTAYNAFGQVTSSTQYAQAISTSGISTSTPPGLPAAATRTSGADRTTTYAYDAIGRVTTELDIGGYNQNTGYATANVSIVYTYNGENQVLSKTHNSAATTYTYDTLGRVLTVTAPSRGALVSNWQSILESTPADNLTTAALYTNVSPVTTYVYDAQGHALSTNVSAGGLTQQSYATYNALGQLTQSVDANGFAHTVTYDANGNVLTQSYTIAGSTTVTTTNTYDANNQRLSTAVQRSGVSAYDSYTQQKYDAFGEVIAKGDNAGYEATYTYNTAGQQTSALDSHGATHTYSYDLVGNLVVDRSTVTGGASAVWTHNTYNLSNQVVSQVTPATNAATGEGSTPVSLSYDRWGNVIAKTDANGNLTTYQYDSQNHLVQQTGANVLVVSASGVYTWSQPVETWDYNVNGELQQHTDANGNVSVYVYDAAGNQTQVEDGTGAYTYTAYDALGRAVAVQTPPVQTATGTLANITFTSYDNLNQVTGQGYFQLNANGSARTPVTQSTYTLNANGDRIKTTDALGNSITYTYDSQHRVLSSTTPLSETTLYAYDANGNLVHQTDADGYTQSWTYNYFKQVQSHTDESGATYTYTYDANSGLLVTETSNWTSTGPSSATTSTLTFGYEANGALASLTEAVTSGSSTVNSTYGFSYDANGNETLETINTQDGGGNAVSTQIAIAYDSHNRLQEVTDENGAGTAATLRTVYVYDADGNRRAVFARSAYDPQGTSSAPIAATPIPLTAGAPALGTALTNQTASLSGASFAAMSYSVAGNFSDPLGMGLTYTATGMPSWLSFNGTTGVFSGTPPVPTAPGSYTVTVTAMDVLGRSVSSSFTVTVPTVNPVFSSAPSNQTAQPGQAWSYQAPAATDANGYAITYSFSGNLPPGISFNASTRTFSGTPSTGNTYPVTYTATSSAGTTVSASFTITVPNVQPVFTGGISTQTLQPGQGWSYQAPAATDANGYGITYSAAGLPSGISFNATTRTFSGSLTGNGSWQVTYTAAANSGGQSVSQAFYITVPTVTPVFSGGMANQSATATVAMNAYTAPAATDANGASITYSASGMPPGVSFDASSRTFSGTPSSSGTYSVTYTATASNGAVASTTFTITVNPASPPVTTGGGTGSAHFTFGRSGTAQPVVFSNPMGRSLSYSLTWVSGGSNRYISLGAGGSVVYSPPAINNGVGSTYTVNITATDPVDGLSCTATGISIVIASSGTAAVSTMSTMAPATATSMATTTATPAPTPNVQANWFTYDADNRVLVADGSLQGGSIVINQNNTNSGANVYDAAGNVIQYTSYSSGKQTIQKNYYNPLNQLSMVQTTAPGGTTFGAYESRSYDLDGRLIQDVIFNAPGSTETTTSGSFSDAGWVRTDTIYTYNTDGELIDQSEYAEDSAQHLLAQYGSGANVQTSSYATQDQTAPSSLPTLGAATDGVLYLYSENSYAASSGYGYDADGNVLGYHTITGGTGTILNATPTASTVGNQNAYIKQNGLLLATTTLVPTSGSNTVTTSNTYNDLGELAATTTVSNGATQTQVMAYTSGGQVFQKSATSNGSTTTTYYASVNEGQLGSVDTAGNINVLSTTGGFSNGSNGTQSYTVQAGDTLQSLAQAIYGDSNYYYILAQANGLSPTAALTAGMMLHIPQVTTTANAYNTYQPYSAGNVISGGASGMETVAAMLALSVNEIFNQQSAIAQTVAQIEAQAQALATEQAEADKAQTLAAKQRDEAAAYARQADDKSTQAAQAQAAAAQAAGMAKQTQDAAQKALQDAKAAAAKQSSDALWAAEWKLQAAIDKDRKEAADQAMLMGTDPIGMPDPSEGGAYGEGDPSLSGDTGILVDPMIVPIDGTTFADPNSSTVSEPHSSNIGNSGVGNSSIGSTTGSSTVTNLEGVTVTANVTAPVVVTADVSDQDYSLQALLFKDLFGGRTGAFGNGMYDVQKMLNTMADQLTPLIQSVKDAENTATPDLSQYNALETQYQQYNDQYNNFEGQYTDDSNAASNLQSQADQATKDAAASEGAYQYNSTLAGQTQGQIAGLNAQLNQESSSDTSPSAVADSNGVAATGMRSSPFSVGSFDGVTGGAGTNALSGGWSSTTYSDSGAVQSSTSTTYTTGDGQPGLYNSQSGTVLSYGVTLGEDGGGSTFGGASFSNGSIAEQHPSNADGALSSLGYTSYASSDIGNSGSNAPPSNADNEWITDSTQIRAPSFGNLGPEAKMPTFSGNGQSLMDPNLNSSDSNNDSYHLGAGDYIGFGLTGYASATDSLVDYANKHGNIPGIPLEEGEAAEGKILGMQYGVRPLVTDLPNAVGGAITVGEMWHQYNEGDYRGATQSGGSGLGAIAGAELGAAIGAGVVGLEPITIPLGAVVGAVVGAIAGGNAATTIYDNGFEGNINYIMQPITNLKSDMSGAANTLQNILINAQTGGHAW
jgi:YD repeat-containing protein